MESASKVVLIVMGVVGSFALFYSGDDVVREGALALPDFPSAPEAQPDTGVLPNWGPRGSRSASAPVSENFGDSLVLQVEPYAQVADESGLTDTERLTILNRFHERFVSAMAADPGRPEALDQAAFDLMTLSVAALLASTGRADYVTDVDGRFKTKATSDEWEFGAYKARYLFGRGEFLAYDIARERWMDRAEKNPVLPLLGQEIAAYESLFERAAIALSSH